MKKASNNQVRVLSYLKDMPSGRTTAYVFNSICGHPRVVRALFANGWVEGDEVPARYVGLTESGRAVLVSNGTRDGAA